MNKSDILDLIRSSRFPVNKRDIARAFGLKGSGPRVALKKILKALRDDGAIMQVAGGYTIPEGLPAVLIVEAKSIDEHGDVLAAPVEWNTEQQGHPPQIIVVPDPKKGGALGIGERALIRVKRLPRETGEKTDSYEGNIIRRMDAVENRVLGLLRIHKSGHAILTPSDKKAKSEFEIPPHELNDAEDGDLVIGEVQSSGRSMRRKKARIVQIIGKRDDPHAISLISLHEQGLREGFPETVEKAAKGLDIPELKNREDLRDIPLVTIDGADARDFDDAVYAEEFEDEHGSGFHLIVAIADVAYYVRPEKTLDIEAQARGNSTYFPDRVVPMLPEALSNDLCSLRPHENRACMAVHLRIDKSGKLLSYKFVRGLMRSAARLIYEDVQAAFDKQEHEMLEQINALYAAYRVLDKARENRGALDLDLPERQIVINEKGHMTGVRKRERMDAHKMIEEFMVLANVAAAKALEDKRAPCVYRVHERPSLEKLDSVREFVEGFGLSLPKGQVTQPKHLNQVLNKAKDSDYSHLISITILRSQSQAVYSADNKGHFGLALSKYGHFTSPIRRYADLLVHRSLIKAYNLGPGGLDLEQESRLEELCQHISQTERNSMVAERTATDRFTAAFLSDQIGAEFQGRITGVTRFGLFVMLHDSGADGLVPMRSLPDDYYIHDEKAHRLVGRRRGRIYQLGGEVTVRLKEADGLSGSCVLEIVGRDSAIPAGMKEPKTNRHGSRKKFGQRSGKRKEAYSKDKGGDKKKSSKKGKNPYKKRDSHDEKDSSSNPKGGGYKGRDGESNPHKSKKKSKKTTPKHKRKTQARKTDSSPNHKK